MQHYKTVVYDGLGDLLSAYPHSPEDRAQSFNDLLEDQFGQGWEFVSHSDGPYGEIFVFRANAQ